MLKSRNLCRAVVASVIAGLLVTTMPMPRAQAALVTSEELATQRSAAADRARINELLARDEVKSQLETYGISSEEAQARINALSDEEIMQIAGKMDELPAGQSALGVIIGAILVVFIVLLITDILGLTRVFPWTRPVR